MLRKIQRLETTLPHHPHPKVRGVWALIQDQYQAQRLDRHRAARGLRISVSQLDRQLRQAANVTFYSLLRLYRVWMAVQAQEREHLTNTELAERVGFVSEEACVQAFRLHLGMTSAEHRRLLAPTWARAPLTGDGAEPAPGRGPESKGEAT